MTENDDARVDEVVAELKGDGIPPWRQLSIGAARRLEDELFRPTDPPPVGGIRDLAFEGPAVEVPVRTYRPDGDIDRTIVFFHGGGFVLGTLDSIDGLCRRLCRRGNALVISVAYRLAPEHPFPAAVEDGTAALRWAASNTEALGAPSTPIHVGGTSAGANLAAAVARWTVREDGPRLASQLLAYPMLDPGWESIESSPPDDGPLLEGADVEWFWEQYLRSSLDRQHPYAAPLTAASHGELPRSIVLTAGRDVLGPEGQAYAEALIDAGVPVEHRHEPGLPHGFLSLTSQLETADEALEWAVTALKTA